MEKDMKKMTQAALAALVMSFGCGSTLVYADAEIAGKPGPKPTKPHKPGKHGCGDKCDGKIKINLKVDKHCDVDMGDTVLNLARSTAGGGEVWTDSTSFSVDTNSFFRVNYVAPTQLNGAGGSVPVTVATLVYGASYSTGDLLETTSATFDVTATVAGSDYRDARAGDYSNVYTFAVAF